MGEVPLDTLAVSVVVVVAAELVMVVVLIGGVGGGGGTASEKSLTSKISDACLALNSNNHCTRVATTGYRNTCPSGFFKQLKAGRHNGIKIRKVRFKTKRSSVLSAQRP